MLDNITIIKNNCELKQVIKSLINFLYTNKYNLQLENRFFSSNFLLLDYLIENLKLDTLDNSDPRTLIYTFKLNDNIFLESIYFKKSNKVEFDILNKKISLIESNKFINNLLK